MVTDKALYGETIERLVDHFGDAPSVARKLDVNVEDLYRWIEGRGRPPTTLFLRMVDLANEETQTR